MAGEGGKEDNLEDYLMLLKFRGSLKTMEKGERNYSKSYNFLEEEISY